MSDPQPIHTGPTVGAPGPDSLNSALRRNIDALRERRRQEAESRSLSARLADRITGFTGSMTFVAIHLIAYGFWIAANLGWIPGVRPWDETFVVLAMEASVEAIFLSTFVLISQNRMMAAADQRADLDLQIGLLTEHEVTTLVRMVHRIAEKVGVPVATAEVVELERNVAPEAVLDELEADAGEGRDAPL